MPLTRNPSVADLLLELLEVMSLGAAPVEHAERRLRRAYPFTGVARRVADGLEMLAAEGLVERGDDDGLTVYRTTSAGLAALERAGRFPGAAAVLFTDIVGSTELIGRHGEQGAHALRQRHFSLLRRAIAKHGGREVKSLGDGLMVVFADVSAAIECAIAMQRAVDADGDEIGLRVGVHAGELLREGGDFFGTTVVIARRLCESARAGQIVVSEETRDLAGGAVDAVFEPLGDLRLKGFSDEIAAHEIAWTGDRRPSKRAARAAGEQLPVPVEGA